MKKVTFARFMEQAGIEFNHVRYKSQPSYKKRFWEKHKQFYRVFLLGKGYEGEYDELEEALKDVHEGMI